VFSLKPTEYDPNAGFTEERGEGNPALTTLVVGKTKACRVDKSYFGENFPPFSPRQDEQGPTYLKILGVGGGGGYS